MGRPCHPGRAAAARLPRRAPAPREMAGPRPSRPRCANALGLLRGRRPAPTVPAIPPPSGPCIVGDGRPRPSCPRQRRGHRPSHPVRAATAWRTGSAPSSCPTASCGLHGPTGSWP
ncbi:hypothetical protein GQ55_5G019800 [Panicum hallii var. hallii]|uniref:Uncharacterized protein n=1 Tax=Panicum hallii var. hallii TaxID=1504633 RepID=A0A2T7DBV3_9POAL|nr:hypothetical protein GQ55_5G019800 [Panicum hallii var. hallii]